MALHWLPVEQRISFKVALICYNALNNLAPPYIAELLSPYYQSCSLRSADQCLLAENRTKQRYGDRAFQNAAPKLWNSIPPEIRTEKDILVFRKLLKTHFLGKLIINLQFFVLVALRVFLPCKRVINTLTIIMEVFQKSYYRSPNYKL